MHRAAGPDRCAPEARLVPESGKPRFDQCLDEEEAQKDYEETMNDSVTKYACDWKLMVMNEAEKVEKNDHVKQKDYCTAPWTNEAS